MATGLEMIESAMRKINVLSAGETVSAEDSGMCLDILNTMLDSWEVEGMLKYTSVVTTFTLPASTASRTIGPSMQININRPTHIERGSFARISDVDVPIDPISLPEYNEIALKSTESSWPEVLYYDGGHPTGNVYFWPVPVASVEVHLVTPETAGTVALNVDYVWPQGYRRAAEFNLAVEIAPEFRRPVPPDVARLAVSLKRHLKRRNMVIPQMSLDTQRGQYDIQSGTYV